MSSKSSFSTTRETVFRRVLVATLVVAAACSGDAGPGSGRDDGSGTDGSGVDDLPPLACTTLSYCTSWWNLGTAVDALPAPTGGAVSDGTWILVDVLARDVVMDVTLREALVIEGSRFRGTDTLLSDGSGTFSTSGSTITFDSTLSCGRLGEDFGPGFTDPQSFAYTADGDELLLFDDEHFFFYDEPIPVALVYAKVSGDPCDPPGTATCSLDACFCAYATDGLLTDAECGG